MLTTGSKLLIGSAVLATIAAIVYGIDQGGAIGTVGLASAAAALSFLAGVNLLTRDANVFADDENAIDSCQAADPAPGDSIWPMAFALGAVVLCVGLVTYPAVFIVGIVLLLAAGAEWMTQAWAEQASHEAAHNSEVRSRIANPLEFPLAAAIGVGIVVFAFSRIMLWLEKVGTVVAFGVLAGIIVIVAFLFAYRGGLRSRTAIGAIGVAVVGLVAGGAVAGLDGERDIHPHETTAELADEGICEDPEETEADHNAAQSVGATAAVAAELTLSESGELTFEVNGPIPAGATALTLPSSNLNNVLFHNESSEDRRLSVDFGTKTVTHDGEDEVVANQICTTLVEDGGVQNMFVEVGLPSSTNPGGYFFFVPGVDTATLELVVP